MPVDMHKARIQLEGNPVFQALRLELATLKEERTELVKTLWLYAEDEESAARKTLRKLGEAR